ncbi:LysR family transcriptional regulator [Marinobacter nanhaiticus D15-8W]|uniref:LysR family transcriptional regulator n=1 Tax=Marinobacter nanhaiticus D15-8W TaxID=626887 RepID=N6VXW1_9GAMM|nr:LysR family transcriptional regulator [Marinobacter nanhaiticus]ENO12689.1 LysR family transcriptional regulator [Marinobacter nanhaiticus D15-8W]BES70029.1 LysR family transcriptional regulator [Marinobacter nanhaiticus D15-8W]
MSKPSYKSLEVFEAVARLKSYAKAANELCIDYTGVSKHVKALEAYYNLRLIGKPGKELELTAVGEDVANRLSIGFEAINSACSAMRDNPKLEVKVPVTFGLRWLLENAPYELLGDNVNFHIAWRHSVDFLQERFDLAIIFSDEVSTNYFYKERLVAVADPLYLEKFLSKGKIDKNKIKEAVLVSPSINKSDWYVYFARSQLNQSLIEEAKILVADSMNSALDIVERIGGITVVDILYVQKELESGKLIPVFDYIVETGLGYKLVCPKTMEDSRIYRSFLDWLVTHPCLIDSASLSKLKLRLIPWTNESV